MAPSAELKKVHDSKFRAGEWALCRNMGCCRMQVYFGSKCTICGTSFSTLEIDYKKQFDDEEEKEKEGIEAYQKKTHSGGGGSSTPITFVATSKALATVWDSYVHPILISDNAWWKSNMKHYGDDYEMVYKFLDKIYESEAMSKKELSCGSKSGMLNMMRTTQTKHSNEQILMNVITIFDDAESKGFDFSTL